MFKKISFITLITFLAIMLHVVVNATPDKIPTQQLQNAGEQMIHLYSDGVAHRNTNFFNGAYFYEGNVAAGDTVIFVMADTLNANCLLRRIITYQGHASADSLRVKFSGDNVNLFFADADTFSYYPVKKVADIWDFGDYDTLRFINECASDAIPIKIKLFGICK